MKNPIAILGFSILICSCEGNDKNGNSKDSTPDSISKPVVHVPVLDSVGLNASLCKFHCQREKTVKELEKDIRVLGNIAHVKLDNASVSSHADLTVQSGNWYTVDGKLKSGLLVIDMASVETVKVGDDERLEMGNPDYLEVKKFPYAYLTIDSISISTDSLGNKMATISGARLKIKDNENGIQVKNVVMVLMKKGVPEYLTFDFTIDGIEWGLNGKDANVTKDKLHFHVGMRQ